MNKKKQEKIQVNPTTGLEIAVIGMAGRFPDAPNINEFWNNLKNGKEPVVFLSEQERIKPGPDQNVGENPDFVSSIGGDLADKEFFDAAFFDYTPKEAEIMEPQIRFFHECCWEALEDAGIIPGSYEGKIGLYAGASASANFYWQVLSHLSGKHDELGQYAGRTLINRDYLTTRVSYKLDLRGPSSLVQTTCSTSLVAIHMACRALLTGECHIALAGGVRINTEPNQGYLYQEGLISSPDGHCRAFDANARGTFGGNGLGVVVLKSLKNAVQDGDNIHAVIKGTAVNNDGIGKVGFTAPGINGQAEVIKAALRFARVEPESISYVEAHGTGTSLGDKIEIEALKRAFNTGKKGFCGIGSVKSNIGHLDTAAGVTGFIKTVLALKYKKIPPSLHFQKPNPQIDFENSPFYVNARLKNWEQDTYPRRAGVSSFGIGGTNAHVILEEAPGPEQSITGREVKLFILSARTQSALDRLAQNLVLHLKENPGINLADVAYTLQTGRKPFQYRKTCVCATVEEAISILLSPGSESHDVMSRAHQSPPVAFMFPGQGSQYVGMGWDLYRTEPVFRTEIDRCFEILNSLIDYDIREILYPGDLVSKVSKVSEESSPGCNQYNRSNRSYTSYKSYKSNINQTETAQLAIFIIEYALAKLLMRWGLKPSALIGHSIGEYTAACLSGVFSLEDALSLVLERGKMMQDIPQGSMLSLRLSQEELISLLAGHGNKELALAAVNSPSHCVISGPDRAIADFSQKMEEKGVLVKRLHTSHAFHSPMMKPILKKIQDKVSQIKLNNPGIPYISNLTGKFITAEEVKDPGYWPSHLSSTVRFAEGLKNLLLKEKNTVFIEIGPGQSLSIFVQSLLKKKDTPMVVNTIRHPLKKTRDDYYFLNCIGRLWSMGVQVDWPELYSHEKRRKISLPTYPFERRYFPVPRLINREPSQQPVIDNETKPVDLDNKPVTGGNETGFASPLLSPEKQEIELTLMEIWKKLLGIEHINIYDEFFAVGGDSLTLVQLHKEISKKYPNRIGVDDLFNNQTIAQLTLLIANPDNPAGEQTGREIERIDF